MNIGWLVLSRMRSAVRRLCGQPSDPPIAVAHQSWARVRAPISPPPARKSAFLARSRCNMTPGGPPALHYAAGTNRLSRRANARSRFWFRFICAELEQNCGLLRRYFIRPAAVSARVITAPTSIAARRGALPDLAKLGDTAIGQGIGLMSGAAAGAAAGSLIAVAVAAATPSAAVMGW